MHIFVFSQLPSPTPPPPPIIRHTTYTGRTTLVYRVSFPSSPSPPPTLPDLRASMIPLGYIPASRTMRVPLLLLLLLSTLFFLLLSLTFIKKSIFFPNAFLHIYALIYVNSSGFSESSSLDSSQIFLFASDTRGGGMSHPPPPTPWMPLEPPNVLHHFHLRLPLHWMQLLEGGEGKGGKGGGGGRRDWLALINTLNTSFSVGGNA